MLDRLGEAVSVVLGALAIAYLVYEIDRRQWKLHDLWDVLDGEDAVITNTLEDMVERGELCLSRERRSLDLGREPSFVERCRRCRASRDGRCADAERAAGAHGGGAAERGRPAADHCRGSWPRRAGRPWGAVSARQRNCPHPRRLEASGAMGRSKPAQIRPVHDPSNQPLPRRLGAPLSA